MERSPRQRHYVSRITLLMLQPFFRYSVARSAYVLRLVGGHYGPVLRENQRRAQRPFSGPDRRDAAGQLDIAL